MPPPRRPAWTNVARGRMKLRVLSRRERERTMTVGFDEVVLPHLDAAYNLARWLVRDPVLAQDVVQDAAVKALGYFRSYHGGDGRAWLLRIVRNAAYDALGARGREATKAWTRTTASPTSPPCSWLIPVQTPRPLSRGSRSAGSWTGRWPHSRSICGSAWCSGSSRSFCTTDRADHRAADRDCHVQVVARAAGADAGCGREGTR